MIPDTDTKACGNVTAAAEALVKAVCSHVESTSLSVGTVKTLSNDSSSIDKSVRDLKETFDAKINTLNLSVLSLKSELTKLNEQTKRQTLEWAIDNVSLFSFRYREGIYIQIDSSKLVRDILISFRKGLGYFIDNRMLEDDGYYGVWSAAKKEDSEKKFREAVESTIYNLTGVKPRIDKTNGRFAIYYS